MPEEPSASSKETTVVKTQKSGDTPPIKEEKTLPVPEKTTPVATQSKPYVRPPVVNHGKAILDFLESRHTGQFIKINDFLKSLYPVPNGKEKPAWEDQGNMRRLQKTLMDLSANEGVLFLNLNHTRLGDNYHDGEERRRKDYNIADLTIEARLP